MIVSIPSQLNALPGRVQAFARSMWISAGRVPKPIRRWKPRCWYKAESAEKIVSSACWMSLIAPPSVWDTRSSHTCSRMPGSRSSAAASPAAACSTTSAGSGWEDVVLLEEDELTSGSTWHAAGLCTQFNPSYNLMGLLRYSVELYKTLAADYHECGSVRLATTPDRVDEFRHRAATAELLDVPVEVVGPERARELHPLIEVGDVLAAAYLPTDGHVDPSSLTHAFAADAGDRDLPAHAGDGPRALRRRVDAHDLEGRCPGRDRRRRRRPVGAEGRPARRVRTCRSSRSSITTSSPTRFRR